MHSSLASDIRRLRLRRNLTQLELATRAGISLRSVAALESPQTTNWTLSTMEAIATALGVSLEVSLKDDETS